MARRNHFKSVQRKKYKTSSYSNPYFKGPKNQNLKKGIYIALGAAIFIGCAAFFFSHSFFKIAVVEINGVEYIDRTDLEEVVLSYVNESVYLFFDKSNQFLFSKDQMSELLTSEFALASVSVKHGAGRLKIEIEERTSNLVWVTNGSVYIADLSGVIVRELDAGTLEWLRSGIIPEGAPVDAAHLISLPLFTDKNSIDVTLGSVVFKEIEIENIIQFHEGLIERGIEFSGTDIDRLAGKWMRVGTVRGYGILFDAVGNIEEQLRNLDVVLHEKAERVDDLDYIDLRFGDRIYYK
jgi:hypothetical protein